MIQQNPRDPNTKATGRELKRLRRLAKLLDTAVGIPGTKLRVGIDSIAGLVPVVGDGLTAVASAYIVHRAKKLGASKNTLTKMYGNVALDLLLGSVPLVGDLFDAGFKSNTRNLRLLEQEMEKGRIGVPARDHPDD